MSLQEQINKFCWYHQIDINGTVTPGPLPHCPSAYKIPEDLTGKRVLDVGAWDGYWTFEALKRGAKEVVAIDDWSDIADTELANNPTQISKRIQWDTFDFVKKELGYSGNQCRRITMSLYDVAELGMFDIVFFFGVLYHCRYPLLALDKMSEVCTNEIYIESAICNDFSPYRGVGAGYGNQKDIVMEFYPTNEFGKMPTNWWSPTLNCLAQVVLVSGFGNVDVWKFNQPPELRLCRGFCKGVK